MINRAESQDKLVPKYEKFRSPIAFSFSLKEGMTNHLSTIIKEDKESLSKPKCVS